MKTSATSNWIQVRKELYRQVHHHVQLILGESTGGLKSFEKAYESEFKKAWKPSGRDELLDAIERSQLVFMGDFHALHQSQKAHLRILKALDANNILVAIECVEARHQKTLEKFIEGKMSDKDFLKAVEWKKSWGFPWEHYRPFFRWAQKHRVKVFGLNVATRKINAKTLKQRDVFASKKIAEIRQQSLGKKIFVIYGDLHLAEGHLMAAIKKTALKKIPRLTIFQNSEKIYFEMLEKEVEDKVDVVRLSKNKFCLQNVPPWVKWQNYLLFLEEHFDKNLDEELDLTDVVASYVKLIGEDLSIPVKTDHFSVMGLTDRSFWGSLEKKISGKEKQFIQSWVEDGRSFYLPSLSLGFLARASVNNAAQLAMAVVFSDLNSYQQLPFQMPQDFVRLIWLEAAQYFGSKLVNPKRKTNTLTDIKNQLSASHPDDHGKSAMQLALSQKMLELMHLSGARTGREQVRPRKAKAYQEAARILGGMLGEKMYFGYRQKLISKASLLALLKKPVGNQAFQEIYWEILETIESLPEPFKSKTEKV